MYGLAEKNLQILQAVFQQFPDVQQAILYGSRAMGTYSTASDIDITLVGKGLTRSSLAAINTALDDTSIPYLLDISLYNNITNSVLCEHIRKHGKIIYNREVLQHI